ncbi:hypothetical protein JMJ35_008498 [Cladonia borealis]|uniref:DUF6594 domain-containing protein n=1 Tax=Cladonia borealis TaxID=184061 RepID=A0AA39UYZ4_9LECA|nr:hypothetical protein JMJ35_008498 [Cladonia borealis]
MSMPELHEGNSHVLGPLTTTVDGVPESRNGYNGAPQPQESVTSPGDNVSEIPFPFDSEWSEDEENGNSRSNLVRNRIRAIFHLQKKYPPGYEDKKVEQIIRSLDEYPAGYGKIAAIADLDSDFLICRKFGFLHKYALLYLQDELVEIEEDLERLDKWEFRDGDPKNLVSRRRDRGLGHEARQKLIARLHAKLKQYDEAVLRLKELQAIKRPTMRAQSNVYNLINNTQSLAGCEADWICQGPDLAAVACGTEHRWLNTFLEDALNWLPTRVILAVFRGSEQKAKTGSEELNLLSADRVDILLRFVIATIAAILLLVPVLVLFRLQPTSREDFERKSNYQILTIFGFALAFSASCSMSTKARRQVFFIATAAYSAILVLFLLVFLEIQRISWCRV